MYALDLFAGVGWGVACKELGIEEYGVENDPHVIGTRSINDMRTIYADVWTGLHKPELVPAHDILIASPPCQTYSVAGNGAGREALDQVLSLVKNKVYHEGYNIQNITSRLNFDDRTALVLAPLAYVSRHRPKYVVMEQVPTVLPVWEAFAEEMREMGYSVWTGHLHAEQYGVPQTRKRAFLIARRDGEEAQPPVPTHSKYHTRNPDKLDDGLPFWVSMAEALGWTEDDTREMVSNYSNNGDAAVKGTRDSSQPSPTVTGKVGRNKWRINNQSGGASDAEWTHKRPAPTIAGRGLVPAPGANANRFNGSTKSRNDGINVTIEEAAILQSFPENFKWETGSVKTANFQIIGNAVPPLLAKIILKNFMN